MDGDALALGRLAADVVIVIDINKLADQKKGDGLTVPTYVFKEGRNLVGVDLLPPEVREAFTAEHWETKALAGRILSDVFGWQRGDLPVFRLIKGATGELGLGLLRADETHYFGVVNVGDATGLKKALEAVHLAVEDDALSASLFADLSRHDSKLNLLIGSRRFAEGWDNYRACSLTLLRLGQGEGSLIIQMFGRVVRFAGRSGDGKRLADPPKSLKPLQTAYVYGLRSKYLDAFLAGLYENGVPSVRRHECEVVFTWPTPNLLHAITSTVPEPSEFTVNLSGDGWLRSVKAITHSVGVAVEVTRLGQDGLDIEQGKAGQDLTEAFKQRLAVIDEDAVYRDMVSLKRQQRWWNFAFDRSAIRSALRSDRYSIVGLPSVLELRSAADLARLQLEQCRAYGFSDPSATVRSALDRLRQGLDEERSLRESAALYAEVYEEDEDLKALTESALTNWPR